MMEHPPTYEEMRQDLLDDDMESSEIEQKIGEGWTMQQIYEDFYERMG